MSLSNRLSGFFLAALAIVLLGFSTTLYALAKVYLERKVSTRMDSALAILAAAAEFEDDGIEWDTRARILTLGQDTSPNGLRGPAARSASHRRHLATAARTRPAAHTTTGATRRPAARAAARLVLQPLRREKLLLASAENELSTAIPTDEGLILIHVRL